MRGGLAAIAAGGVLLSSCGLFDANVSILPVPAALRYDPARPVAENYPDVRAVAKTSGRSLFFHKPDRISISAPIYVRQTGYKVCARVNDVSGHPPMVARILHGTFVDRRRATQRDRCDGEKFEDIVVD